MARVALGRKGNFGSVAKEKGNKKLSKDKADAFHG